MGVLDGELMGHFGPHRGFLVVWLVLAFASTLYAGFDQYRNNPEPAVMK